MPSGTVALVRAVAMLVLLPSAALTLSANVPDRMNVLQRRMASIASPEVDAKLLVLDCMVPMQRFEILLKPPVGSTIKRAREAEETICVVGMQHTMSRSGRPQFGKPLYRGVEGRIETMLPIAAGDGIGNGVNFYAQHTAPLGVTTVRGGGGQRVYMNYETTIVGGRRFEVVECAALDAWPANDGQPNKFKGPLFDARIRWIGEDEELASPGSPEAAMAESLEPLVKEWTNLVLMGDLEKERGQLKAILADLGPMPPPEEADLRALWVAGLICPLPGLAIEPRLELELECRPAILNAGTTLERVEAARLGIQRCIERLREL